MVSSGLLRRVALVRTDVSEDPSASFIRVTKIGELGTTQAATSNRRTLRRTTPDDNFFHSHRLENLKSYIENITFRKRYLFPSSGEGRETPTEFGVLRKG
jgi:hypothetical protein